MEYRIDPRKIIHYLLSDKTPESAGKNKFFRGIGYRPDAWRTLEADLLSHPHTATLEDEDLFALHGVKYIFRCNMVASPNGRTYCLRTVWQERDGDRWFVTAYPQPTP